MEKMGYPKGLVRYTNEHANEGRDHRVIRPRMIFYAVILLAVFSSFSYALGQRVPFEVDVIRDRNALYTTTMDGLIENVYSIKLLNMSQEQQTYQVTVDGLDDIHVLGDMTISVASGEVATIPVRLQVDPDDLGIGRNTIVFRAIAVDNPAVFAESESRFLGPSARK